MAYQIVPQTIKGITHPLIQEMYLKKDKGNTNQDIDVLVLETYHFDYDDDHQDFDSYLLDLLIDLDDLKKQAEIKVGHIDRIDIRGH